MQYCTCHINQSKVVQVHQIKFLNYQMFTPSGGKDKCIRKLEFVERSKLFLSFRKMKLVSQVQCMVRFSPKSEL